MNRRPRKRGSTIRKADNWLWYGLIVAATLIAVSVIALMPRMKGEEVDEQLLCPKDSGPVAGIAILFDVSDPLKPIEHKRLRSFFEQRINDAEQNTLIAVGAVGAVDAETKAQEDIFPRCKPMEGKHANELYQNRKKIEERYQNEFLKLFKDKLNEMMHHEPANTSPIMESLQALLVSTPGFVDATYPRHVIIVSDLIQHSEVFSFYRGDTWAQFINSKDAQRLAGRLKDAEVEICRIPRPKADVDMKQVDNFWSRYFRRAGVVFPPSTSTCNLGDL